jgi:AcrR family transcriptional regulator
MTDKSYHHGDLKNALIQAGIELLAREGVHALSLRKVAARAGVSHAAPYSHFADKQGLIAAISTEGHHKTRARVEAVLAVYQHDPLQLLVRTAWAYAQFALQEPDHFKITYSGYVEKEQSYPALVQAAHDSFYLLTEVVSRCQAQGILRPGPPDLMAVAVWGTVHGCVTLVLEGQISHAITDRYTWQQMLIFVLGEMTLVPIPPDILGD